MRAILLLSCVYIAAVSAVPPAQRIASGVATTISRYPSAASLLFSKSGASFYQACAGSILNVRSILSAAHCFVGDPVNKWRVRVGSTYANSGGVVHTVAAITYHSNYSVNNIAVLRTSNNINFVTNAVQAGTFAGSNYNLRVNDQLWAIGWGSIIPGGPSSEILHHVPNFVVPQSVCTACWAAANRQITANMLCAGYVEYGGRDQCPGDDGGPLYHNGTVVGVSSWGSTCGDPSFPSVNTRVSRYIEWIQANA